MRGSNEDDGFDLFRFIRRYFKHVDDETFETTHEEIVREFQREIGRTYVEDLLTRAKDRHRTPQRAAAAGGWKHRTSFNHAWKSGKVSSTAAALFRLKDSEAMRFDTVKWRKRGYQAAMNTSRRLLEGSKEKVSLAQVDELFRLFESSAAAVANSHYVGNWAAHFLLCVSVLSSEDGTDE